MLTDGGFFGRFAVALIGDAHQKLFDVTVENFSNNSFTISFL